jgi:hypothetical protein
MIYGLQNRPSSCIYAFAIQDFVAGNHAHLMHLMPTIPQSELTGLPPATEAPIIPCRRRKINSLRSFSDLPDEELVKAILVILIPFLILESFFRTISKSFWFDEILTIFVSSQAHVSTMWDLLMHGVDTHPLGLYVIEHVMGKFGGNGRLAYRLPSALAFLCAMQCVFIFVRRRAGSLIALIAASTLLLTNFYSAYAFEARPYSMLVAAISVALLCYERADSKIRTFGFALCLAAASSLHFYAFFAFVPFALAELIYLLTERRFRTSIWAGFVIGILPYIVFMPVIHETRSLYGARFWAPPTFWRFASSMGELTRSMTGFGVAAFACALIYFLHAIYVSRNVTRGTSAPGSGFSLPDLGMTFGFLTIPILTFVFAKIAQGGITGRYSITATLGISLAVGQMLSRLKRPTILLAGIFLLTMFVFQEGLFWRNVMRARGLQDPMQVVAQEAEELNLPVVISHGIVYLPAWYGAREPFKSRLHFLADPEEQYAASGSDTTTLDLVTLKNYAPVNVDPFPDFATVNRSFLLYSDGDPEDFWPRWLIKHGYSLRVIDIDSQAKNPSEPDLPYQPKSILFRVDLDKSS